MHRQPVDTVRQHLNRDYEIRVVPTSSEVPTTGLALVPIAPRTTNQEDAPDGAVLVYLAGHQVSRIVWHKRLRETFEYVAEGERSYRALCSAVWGSLSAACDYAEAV